MIKSLSELLRRIQESEAERLDQHRISHGPTIGSMYEGLTKELVDQAIPPGLDVRVVDGFVEGLDRKLSPQSDILIVQGEGEQIPHTAAFIYPVKQVLAVFEIKKSLGGTALDDGMRKMSAVLELHRKWVARTDQDVDFRPAVQSFALGTGHWPVSDEAATELPNGIGAIFDIFKLDQTAPVRVIWGYGGYKSEKSLRTGFLGRMQAAAERADYSPFRLPSLIASGQNALVKMSGQPYVSRIKDGWWDLLTSNHENPVRPLIELLWTKIGLALGVGFPMDDTLVMERLAPFLQARMIPEGVEYRHIELTKKQLQAQLPQEWKPDAPSLDETVLMMGADKGIDLNDGSLRKFASEEGFDLNEAIRRLVDRRQLAWTSETSLRRIAPTTITSFGPGGEISGASNPDLLGLWLSQNLIPRMAKMNEAAQGQEKKSS